VENTSRLYETLVSVLRQPQQWLDLRHIQTLAWMMVGLMESGLIGLHAWAPYVQGRAQFAQSTVRRFDWWRDNAQIKAHALYGPLIQQAQSFAMNILRVNHVDNVSQALFNNCMNLNHELCRSDVELNSHATLSTAKSTLDKPARPCYYIR